MSAASKKYVPPVQGRQSEVSAIRMRVEATELDRYIDLAVDFLDGQPNNMWSVDGHILHNQRQL